MISFTCGISNRNQPTNKKIHRYRQQYDGYQRGRGAGGGYRG